MSYKRDSTVTVILPSFDESKSLRKILAETPPLLERHGYSTTMLVVNDLGRRDDCLEDVCSLHNAVLIDTPYNMGSQAAIVFGIRYHLEHFSSHFAVTFDADGQDDMEMIPILLSEVSPNTIVVAQRTGKRPEGKWFSSLYFLYKKFFSLLTRVTPDFGNFAAYDRSMAEYISRSPYSDMTYSMALPLLGSIQRIECPRLRRLEGRSRVGYGGLFEHALRSALPHLNTISRRIAIFSAFPAALGMALVFISSWLRIFIPEYAFPNWATTIAFGVAILSLQLLTICLQLFLTASLSRVILSSRGDSH